MFVKLAKKSWGGGGGGVEFFFQLKLAFFPKLLPSCWPRELSENGFLEEAFICVIH